MNLANKITVARIFLVPVIMFFLLVDLNLPLIQLPEFNDTIFTITYNQIIATLIFSIAAITDTIGWAYSSKA